MNKNEFIKQAADQIKVFIANSEFQKANLLITKTLSHFPDAGAIISLRKRVIKEVKSVNKELIKLKIHQAKKFSKEENYPEAIRTLKEAQKLDLYSNKVNRLLYKNQERYKKHLQNYFEVNFAEQERRVDELFQKDPEEMIELVRKIELNSPPNKKIQKLVLDSQNRYINHKIQQNKSLLLSGKYNSIQTLIQTLKNKTRENNPIIRDLESKIKLRQLQDQKYEKYDFIYESKKNLSTLIQLKKYTKALQFADELLKIVPEDKEIIKNRKLISRKLFYINRDQIIDQIIASHKMATD